MPNAPRSSTTRRSRASARKTAQAAQVRKFLDQRAERQAQFFASAKAAGVDELSARRLLLAIRAYKGPIRGVTDLVNATLARRAAAS